MFRSAGLRVFTGVGLMLLAASAARAQATSAWVFYGPDGALQYKTLPNGDRIMDFSHAGYGGGGVPLPRVPTAETLAPSGGDDTMAIQEAINRVSTLPLSGGLRGAVVLSPGTYTVTRTLRIQASGVVLRGAGSAEGGTVVNLAGTAFRFVSIGGSGSPTTSNRVSILDPYVPSGAQTFTVVDAAGFSVGDDVFVQRPVTEAWIHLLGMDLLVRNGLPQTWLSPGTWIATDRRIAAIDGNRITLDVPLSDSIDALYLNPPGGQLEKYSWPTRIARVGVEGLRIFAPPPSRDPSGPKFQLLQTTAVVDAWMKDVFMKECLNCMNLGGKRITIEDVTIEHTVNVSGAPYPGDFGFVGTQILLNRVRDLNAINTYNIVTASKVNGPNVALNLHATGKSTLQPHQRWSTGVLVDLSYVEGAIRLDDRGNAGSGHGWVAGWSVAWNSSSNMFAIWSPPGAPNWSIGNIGRNSASASHDNGIYDSHNVRVTPSSLYLAQLQERVGPDALAHLGYSSMPEPPIAVPTAGPTPIPTPTPVSPYGPNLALNKPASASTTWSSGYTAAKAFDGSDSSRWSAASLQGTDQWIAVDLLEPTRYNCAVLKEISYRRVQSHVLQMSDDGVTFTDVPGTAGATIGSAREVCFSTVTSRYVRLFMPESRQSGVLREPTINEVAIYFQDRGPVITVPAEVMAEATGPNGAIVAFAATAADEMDGDVPVTLEPPSGTLFALGATTVTASATDSAGNTSTLTFEVVVDDGTPPSLSLPAPPAVETNDPAGAVVAFIASAHDIVSGEVPVDLAPRSGSLFPAGTTTVTASAVDAAGNQATGTFTVTVAIAAWSSAGKAYAVGQVATHQGATWKCIQAHRSQSDWPPSLVPALWVKVAAGSEWDSPVQYAPGDEVFHNGRKYRCRQAHTSQAGWVPPATPALWLRVSQ
jgi:hypothetical protein